MKDVGTEMTNGIIKKIFTNEQSYDIGFIKPQQNSYRCLDPKHGLYEK
jgi:hypothetical protein